MSTKLLNRSGALGAVLALAACGGSSEVALSPVEFEGMDDNATVASLAQGVTLGSEDAPITVAEFGDYQCPGCASFALNVKPQVDLAYVQEGQVKFVFYDFPLINIHPHAFVAARAARCAGDQDRFWDYHNELFRNQRAWSLSAGAPLGLFEDYAEALDLNAGEFRSCLRSDRHAEVVSANLQLSTLLGINTTPTVVVSRGSGMTRRLPGADMGSIQEAVEEMLAEVGGQGGNGGE
jgi:protein-disulfide isomerase